MRCALLLVISFLAACSSLDISRPFDKGTSRTFDAPIARVKPAFVSTLAQMGMTISSVETRGRNEVLKARKAQKSVEIEFERMGANSTRVRVSGSDDAQIMRDTGKRLAAG